MYSAFDAVRGHDRTHIRRMSYEEYDTMLRAPANSTARQVGGDLLHSRDPNVQFVLRYPLFDKDGKELSVMDQIREFEWEAERWRLSRGGEAARRSGVRLSAEISVGTEESLNDGDREETQAPPHQQQYNAASALIDLDVSSTSTEVTQNNRDSQRSVSGPFRGGSDFSIARDSGFNLDTHLPEPQHLRRISFQRTCPNANEAAVGGGKPPTVPQNFAGPVVHRKDDPTRNEACAGAGVDDGKAGATELGDLPFEDPFRPTIMARGSEQRATKQLFTNGRQTVSLSDRHTIKYVSLISSQEYGGLTSRVVHEEAVAQHIEQNLKHAPGLFTDFSADSSPAPTLRAHTTVTVGNRRFAVGRYFPSADAFEALELDTLNRPSQPVLIYRWRRSALPRGGDESRRAAVGLSICSPATNVGGCAYADGGVTIVAANAELIPLSTLSIDAEVYPTIIKLLLKMLSDLVVKRIVHGSLHGFTDVFVGVTPDKQVVAVPVHWERFVDFGMFFDRNVGRTVLFQRISSTQAPFGHEKDVATLLSTCFAMNASAQLSQQQQAMLTELAQLTTNSTQIANYIVQLKNTMATIPTDLPALHSALRETQSLAR